MNANCQWQFYQNDQIARQLPIQILQPSIEAGMLAHITDHFPAAEENDPIGSGVEQDQDEGYDERDDVGLL
jgi:hypothetical protein